MLKHSAQRLDRLEGINARPPPIDEQQAGPG
jgi:hypothetical protein